MSSSIMTATQVFFPLKTNSIITKFMTDNVLWEIKNITENAESLHNLLKTVNLSDTIFFQYIFFKAIQHILFFLSYC